LSRLAKYFKAERFREQFRKAKFHEFATNGLRIKEKLGFHSVRCEVEAIEQRLFFNYQ